ncbi:glycosyltransferase family 2 protein [Kribbella pratensis]|uniref:CDP-glycerol glycerophosphotransferase n=1 Tax=Kribbella pratensis TaxID=2512112 RepID=A0A4R8C4R4_9ACTN|nr:glycosyltransferase [Kribbella pratensis]TDW70840.1 CDP-glycerol glycerophosphotransferase [Kribbella pratensis]
MSSPRLSVVVPFYNVGAYIGDCLDSIARQTWGDFEAILVDDGSPDDSAVIAKEMCARDSRFRIVEQDNAGLGPARNTGIEHATGEYLTFVDSDDLVTRHGFGLLIKALDRTGSDFAGGNARRFNNSYGVRPSWLHGQTFTEDRFATHISETPQLVLDRMVWNKVYRRSFWDEYGYRFPAIRYEDYPVTLKAHLDAVTVDTIAAPVYFWRERESGDSITQQKFQLANIRDRVVSAGLVLDEIEDALPEIRHRVHAHFRQIDLHSILSAFGTVPPEEEQHLVELTSELLGRLDDAVLETASRVAQLQFDAVRAGDVELLRLVALDPDAVKEHLPLSKTDFTLATSIREVSWIDGELSVRGTAEIRHLQSKPSSLRVGLVIAGRNYRLPVRRLPATDLRGEESLVGFEVRVSQELLAKCPAGPSHFDVRMRVGGIRRRDLLRGQKAGSPGWPPGMWIDGTSWIQPGPGKEGAFAVRRLADPCRLTSVEQTPDALVLHGRSAFDEPSLFVSRPLSGGEEELPLEVHGRDFTARLPIRPMLEEINPDDPFSQRTTRAFRMRGPEGREQVLLWTAGDRLVSHAEGGRVVMLTRSTGGYVNLHESPIRMTATAAVAAGNMLVVRGPDWGDVDFSWRRYLPDSDDYVDVACRRTVSDDGWAAVVEMAALEPADWILFATAPDGTSHAVQCEPFLSSRLPLTITRARHTYAVRPLAGTLHLEAT